MTERQTALSQRNLEITDLRVKEQLTYGQIGKKYDLTRQRVHQIVKRVLEQMNKQQTMKENQNEH